MNVDLILTDRALQGLHLTSKKEGIKNQAYFSQKENLVRALDAARDLGVRKILCVPMEPLLSLLKKDRSRWSFEIFGVVPDFFKFVRDTSHYGTTGTALKRILSMPILRKLRLIKVAIGNLPAVLGMKFEIAMNLFLMAEASGFPRLKAMVLHSQITDLALSLGQDNFFRIFHDVAKNELGADPGLATINFCLLNAVLKRNSLAYPWLFAPFNPRGYQMNPNPQTCHYVLKSVPTGVIAEHWNLAHTIPQDVAASYLAQYPFAAATVEMEDVLDPASKDWIRKLH